MQCLETFLIVTIRGNFYWSPVGRYANHLTMPGIFPHNKELSKCQWPPLLRNPGRKKLDLESIRFFSSVQFSRSVVSDSLRPHESQHASTAKIQGHDLNPGPLRWLDSITDTTDMNLSKLWEIVKDRGTWHAAVHGITESDTTEQLNN